MCDQALRCELHCPSPRLQPVRRARLQLDRKPPCAARSLLTLAMADVGHKRGLDGDAVHRPHKKPKTSELPLDQSKRATIDQLVHTFRKKGEFDSIRTAVRAQFEASVRSLCNVLHRM